MAEVLLTGVTHYPPLMGRDEDMSWVLRWTLEDPDIPADAKNPASWPARMQSEWSDDCGRAAAAAHRASLLEGFGAVRRAIDEFQPDVIVMFGDDQNENFQQDGIPAFGLLAYDQFDTEPWKRARFPNVWDEPTDLARTVSGHRSAGVEFATELIQDDFDIVYAYQPLHYPGLSHAFLNAVLLLDYDRTGFSYPLVPITVNCYGRRVVSFGGGLSRFADRAKPFDPPSPNPSRCFQLGAAVARAARRSSLRVAIVASSSWSHAFLTDHTWRLWPDIPADERLYRALVSGDADVFLSTTTADIEAAGQQEVLNWFCLAGAADELSVTPAWSSLVDTHLFNSNKVFAVYPPAAREPA